MNFQEVNFLHNNEDLEELESTGTYCLEGVGGGIVVDGGRVIKSFDCSDCSVRKCVYIANKNQL